MTIMLDVRSAEGNNPDTGLGERYVLDHTLLDGTRPYRDLWADGEKDILWVVLSNGDLGGMGELEVSVGASFKVFPYRVEVLEAKGASGDLETTISGLGCRVDALEVIDTLRVRILDPLFMWTKNEIGRNRIGEYKGKGWSLLGGKKVETLGVVEKDKKYVVGLGQISLGSVYGEALDRYEIGGVSVPFVEDDELDSYEFTDEIGVVSEGGLELRLNGFIGKNLYFASSVLEGEGVVLEVGDHLAGGLLDDEYPLIREGRGKGFLDVEVVETEADFVGGLGRSLRVARSTGAIERGLGLENSPLFYEGVALGFSEPLSAVDVSEASALSVRPDLLSSGLSYVPDGYGIIPTGVAPTSNRPQGVGLVLSLEALSCSYFIMDGEVLKTELVDRLPSRMSADRVYVLSEDFTIHSARSYTQLLFRQGLVPLLNIAGELVGSEMLGLTEASVTAYGLLEQELLGPISGSALFYFLDFKPRVDMGIEFKAGLRALSEGVDYLYRLDDGKLEWVKEKTVSARVENPTSSLYLGLGAKQDTVSITLEQEISEGVRSTENLTEGEDFRLSVDGQSALLTSDLSLNVKTYGSESTLLGSGAVLLDLSLELGDWVVFNGDGVFRKIIGLDEGSFYLSSLEGVDHPSSWVAYDRGYAEGGEITDPTLLNGECFREVPISARPALRLFKTKLDLESLLIERASSSAMYVADESGTRYELRELVPEELESVVLDVNDAHILSGDYYLKVGALGPLYVDQDFTVSETGEVLFDVIVGDEAIMLFRTPRGDLTEYAETDGETLSSPVVVSEYLEQVFEFNFERTSGTVSLDVPLKTGEKIYMVYKPEGETDYVRELAPFNVSREICERTDARTFTFNTLGLDLYPDTDLTVYVGSELLGYLGSASVTVLDSSTFETPYAVDEGVSVYVGYTVSSALGGERVFSTSQAITEPSLVIEEGSSSFIAEDVVLDYISFGSLIRVGGHSFTISSLTTSEGITTVGLSAPARYTVTGSLYALNNGNIFYGISDTSCTSARASNEITFRGDLTSLLYVGSYLIIGEGESHSVLSFELLSNGNTKVVVEGVTSGFDRERSIMLSVRPIPLEGSEDLLLRSSLLIEDTHRLIKYESGVGALLAEGVDYRVEGSQIKLTNGHAVGDGISYYLQYKTLAVISPKMMRGGRVSYPKYSARYLASDNGEALSGLDLVASCYYESADQFLLREKDETLHITSTVSQIISRDKSEEGRTGGQRTTVSAVEGRALGIHDLEAEDFVVREMIKRYDSPIRAVDLVVSTMTGERVGDQDGIFKMEIEPSGLYEVNGLEDPLKKLIKPRYVTFDLSSNFLHPSDPLEGDVSALKKLQKPLIYNEIDDKVLVSGRSVNVSLNVPPFRQSVTYPVYKSMWESHGVSRLFSTEFGHFETLYDVDMSAEGRGTVVGKISNNARADIENITSLTLQKRRFRYRVWAYSATGFSEYPETSGKPSLILSAVPFKDFPINQEGQIDLTKFISEGGDLPDLISGNPEIANPAISVGSPILLGTEGDPLSAVTDANRTSGTDLIGFELETSPRLARVREVINPCVITLGIYNDNLDLVSPTFLERNGQTLSVDRGYTLLESLGADLDEGVSGARTYRVGTDIDLRATTGELVNITDDFPYNLFSTQRVPSALSDLEGTVTTAVTGTEPFEFPALKGLALNDDGDYTLPYTSREYSEQSILPRLGDNLTKFRDSVFDGQYSYPDEIRTLGQMSLGALTVADSMTPFSDGEEVTADARRGDLIVIQPIPLEDSSAGDAIRGYSQLAKVEGDEISTQVFTSPISAGGVIKYSLENAYAHFDETTGLRVAQASTGGTYTTVVEMPTNESNLTYTQLFSALTSVANPTGNLVRFKIYQNGDTSYQTSVISFEITSSAGSYKIDSSLGTFTLNSLVINDDTLVINTNTPWFDFSAPGLTLTNPTLTARHAHALDVDMLSAGSATAQIELDRVGFREGYYLRARARDEVLPTALTVDTCRVTLEEISIIQGSSQIVDSDLNSTDYLNGSAPFVLEKNQIGYVIDLPSWYGEGNARIDRSNLKMSVMTGSEVSETSYIYSGTGALDMSLYRIATRTTSTGNISNIENGDLVILDQGHQAGTYVVRNVVNTDREVVIEGVLGGSDEPVSIGYEMVFPNITDIVDNQNGTFNIICDSEIDTSTFAGAYGVSPLAIITNPTALSEDHTSYETILYAHYEAVNGNTFVNVGYISLENHAFLNAKRQSVSGDDFYSLILQAIVDGGYCAGQNRIPVPAYYIGTYETQWRLVSNPTINVVSTSLHGNEHVPYSFDLIDTDVNEGGFITHVYVDYLNNLPELDTPNNFVPVMIRGDSVEISGSIAYGIYIDTSFPRLKRDLSGLNSNCTVYASAFGPIPYDDFTLSATPVFNFGEYTNVTVRRLRRFTNLFYNLTRSLEGVSLLYAERYGEISSLTSSGLEYTLIASKTDGFDTNVGDFSNVCSEGDLLRAYDAQGGYDLYRVKEVGLENLKLALVSVGSSLLKTSFVITARSGVIPEIQTLNEMISVSFDTVFTGSYGQVDTVNVLSDRDEQISAQIGDYLVIDPQGVLEGLTGPATPVEYGAPPRGDLGKIGQPGYTAGTPHPLDDNRGVYIVTNVTEGVIEVEPVVVSLSDDFNILPTVSGTDAGILRVTAPSDVNNSYLGSSESVEGFSYRILRAKQSDQSSALSALLFLRERTLSWYEQISKLKGLPPYTWSEYCTEGYIAFVGYDDPTHPSNDVILGIIGESLSQPFVNTETCLSILDRRALIGDTGMIEEGYLSSVLGYGEKMNSALSSLSLRESRFYWINKRVNALKGTLARLSRI